MLTALQTRPNHSYLCGMSNLGKARARVIHKHTHTRMEMDTLDSWIRVLEFKGSHRGK